MERVEKLCKEYSNDTNITKTTTNNFSILELKKVHYKYNDNDETILKELDFIITDVNKKAIVGQSGSGKSTLIDIILGYNKINGGQLLLNGTDHFKLEELQKLFSYMPQKNIIFRGTIKENIFFDSNPSKKEIDMITSISGVKEIIQKNHIGLETLIDPYNEEYTNLSEGEKQRICFARLLAKNASLLILDEPTAFLDKNNEDKILEYIKRTEKSIIMVTHRIENIPRNYEVLVLKDGRLERLV